MHEWPRRSSRAAGWRERAHGAGDPQVKRLLARFGQLASGWSALRARFAMSAPSPSASRTSPAPTAFRDSARRRARPRRGHHGHRRAMARFRRARTDLQDHRRQPRPAGRLPQGPGQARPRPDRRPGLRRQRQRQRRQTRGRGTAQLAGRAFRVQLGELLSEITRHLPLMAATHPQGCGHRHPWQAVPYRGPPGVHRRGRAHRRVAHRLARPKPVRRTPRTPTSSPWPSDPAGGTWTVAAPRKVPSYAPWPPTPT